MSMQGVIPVSATCDSLGPMSRSVRDLASLLNVMLDEPKPQPITRRYAAAVLGNWNELSIGVLNPEKRFLPASLAKPNAEAQQQTMSFVISQFSQF